MKKNDKTSVNENPIEQLMEQSRLPYAHMLEMYLQLYKRQDQLVSDIKDEKLKHFYQTDLPYYDENGKINWEIIHQFMPPDTEKRLEEKYRALNTNEIRLCYLLFFKIPYKTISKILPYRKESIRRTIYKIKQKTGLKDIEEMFGKIIVNKASTDTKTTTL